MRKLFILISLIALPLFGQSFSVKNTSTGSNYTMLFTTAPAVSGLGSDAIFSFGAFWAAETGASVSSMRWTTPTILFSSTGATNQYIGAVGGGGSALGGGNFTVNISPAGTTVLGSTDETISITVQFTQGSGYTPSPATYSFSWNHTTHAMGAILALSQKTISFAVTNNTGAIGTWGVFQYASESASSYTGLALGETSISPGGSWNWTIQVSQDDPNFYQVEQANLNLMFSSGNYKIGGPVGGLYLLGAIPVGSASTWLDYATGSGLTALPTLGTSGASLDTDGGYNGGTTVTPVFANSGGAIPPVNITPTTVSGSTVSSAGSGTTGPGTGGSSDAGLADNAAAINGGIAAAATSINSELAASSNNVITQEAKISDGEQNILNQIAANTSQVPSVNLTPVTSAISSASSLAHSDATTAQSSLTAIQNGLAPFATAAASGTSGANTLAGTELTTTQATIASDLSGSGTAFSNGTFYSGGVPLGVSASQTASANGILGTSASDTPFGTIAMLPAMGGRPAWNFTLSLSTLLPWWGDFRTVFYDALVWGAFLLYIYNVQDLFSDAMKILIYTPSLTAQIGPETIAVPGGALVKLYAVAGVWITVIAGIWGGLIAFMGSDFSSLGITISGFFNGTAIASSLPSSMSAAAGFFGAVLAFFPVGVWMSLLATWWFLKWQQVAVLLGAASLVKIMTA